MNIKSLSLLPFFFIWMGLQFSLPDPGENILRGLKEWHDKHPQEKVYVQTDKDKYLAGDPVWIKAWCTIENKPTDLSRILYVDITDVNGNVIEKKMYPLDSTSSAHGVMDINKELKSGNYSLNAYTLWMLNYPQFIFRKKIFIYNSDYKSLTASVKDINHLTFFPEGGDMVEQVSGRIAFKALNKLGYPIGVKGSIYSNTGTKILDFQSQHDGMGMFELQPSINTTYRAKVIFDNGVTTEYDLPVSKKEGATLQVQNSASRVFIMANRGEINKHKYNKLYVVAQINGIPVYKANLNFDEGEAASSIIKKNLPPGIMQITLFDSAENPLAERIIFIENHNIVTPEISFLKISTERRGRNTYSFKLDTLLDPNISVLVQNNIIDPRSYAKENIVSYFLLSSDIKGYIHNPGYYFANKADLTIQNLDLLLMTQGWRRFTWKQIKGQEVINLKYPVESYMNIRGKVTKTGRPEPVTDGFVTIIIKGDDSTSILSKAYLTDKGEFIIDSLSFKQKAEISYQATNNKNVQLPVDVTFYPAFIDTLKRSFYKPGIEPDSSSTSLDRRYLPEYLQSGLTKLDSTGIKVLQNITIKGKKVNQLDSLQKIYVSAAYENSDHSLVVPEGRSYVNIWQYLNANVPGLHVNPFEPGGVRNVTFDRFEGMSLGDSESSSEADRFVKFLLNEMPVAAEVIDGIHPDDVALIKIYKGATAFSFGAEAGAISVYTKKGTVNRKQIFDKSFSNTNKIGYAVTREFYIPNYTSFPELNKNKKDNRAVLYWNPDIKPTKSGNYAIDFHNSDDAKSFKLIIQGIDKKGKLIYKEQIINSSIN